MITKSLFRGLFTESFGELFENPFRAYNDMISKMEEEYESLEEEQFETIKGNVKTVISVRFNNKGFPVTMKYDSEIIEPEETVNQLKEKLAKAVENEDYSLAADLKKKIRDKHEITNNS